eukprot:TRINITY_DN2042_c3_g1_i1.p1 TRINITY_DN2042_c3_g1~~TRINITY_DN2042_c3_g1_i1.p1  ORF type:complete len:659 (-),score=221.24 TRINITY_DN2042_c3_g1_i1:114-2090(-)
MAAGKEEEKNRRIKEIQVANPIRRIIQKVRVAHPETFESIKAELDEALEKAREELGDIFDKVQGEVAKGVAIGQARIENIIEQRETEAREFARPMELTKEMSDMFDEFKAKADAYTEKFNAKQGDNAISKDNVAEVEAELEEFDTQVQTFTKELREFATTKGPEMQAPKLPTKLKRNWSDLIAKVGQCTKDAQGTTTRAKMAVNKVKAEMKKEQFEAAKSTIQERLKDSPGPGAVDDALQAVTEAEKKVEPFMKKHGTEDEMLLLSAEVEVAVETAKSCIETARGLLVPSCDDLDEAIKAEVDAFIANETKVHQVKLGQYENRLRRVSNLVDQYRKKLKQAKDQEIIAELKPQLLESIKALDLESLVESVNAVMKEAETKVETGKKEAATKTPEEMTTLADEMEEQIKVAKEKLTEVRSQLCPVDADLEEEIKKALTIACALATKAVEQKLGLLDRRVARAQIMLSSFRTDIGKKKATRLADARNATLKFVGVLQNPQEGIRLEIDAIFDLVDKKKTGSISEAEFLSLFEKPESFIKGLDSKAKANLKAPSTEDLKLHFATASLDDKKKLSKEAFKKLVATYMKVVKSTVLTQGLSIPNSEVVRELALGEILEISDGPMLEEVVKVQRVAVTAMKDGSKGWATVSGNAGTLFLQETRP